MRKCYADAIGAVLDRHADVGGGNSFLSRGTFTAEWQSFVRDYRSRAIEFEKKWCTRENQRRAAAREVEVLAARRKRAKETEKKVPLEARTKLPPALVPVTKAPLGLVIGDACRRKAQRADTDAE